MVVESRGLLRESAGLHAEGGGEAVLNLARDPCSKTKMV